MQTSSELNESEDHSQSITVFSSVQGSPISSIIVNDLEDSKEIEFFHIKEHKIRVSKKNRIMKQQLNIDDLDDSYTTCFSQENFERLVENQLNKPKTAEKSGLRLEPGSCFLWYILPKSAFKDVISDYEMSKCKKIFKSILDKEPLCHEAQFGLGKLLAHQGLVDRARKHVGNALGIVPYDKLYKIWNAVLQKKEFKNRAEAVSACNLSKYLFVEYPNQLEILWGRMRLGFSKLVECPKDLEQPQVSAARIREIDDYYGYLAWSEVFMNTPAPKRVLLPLTTQNPSENLSEKGVHVLQELIRCFPDRPEAYLRLWQYYTTNSQHNQALEVATECFLKVAEYPEYFSVICLNLAKSNFFLGFVAKSLDILQQKHKERPTFSVFLYQYGKLCVKTGQDSYLPTGIGALREVLRNCDKARIGKINYWLFKAFIRYKDLTSAVKALQNAGLKIKSGKKTEIIKNELKLYSRLISLLQSAQAWVQDEKDEKWEKFWIICQEISTFDSYQSDLLISQGLWKLGKDLEAIENLLKSVNKSSKLQSYFQLLKYLIAKEDYRTAHREGKIMLKKSKNSPIQDWIKAHILYAFTLMHNQKPYKGIILLKCLGKSFPYIPYTFIPYVQQLRKANCIEDLYDAVENALEASVNYTESSFQLDKILSPALVATYSEEKLSNQDICNKLLNEDSIFTETNSSVGVKDISISGIFNKYRNSKASGSSCNSFNSEKLKNLMKSYEQCYFVGYGISSNPKFLFAIGKISSICSVEIEDGLCAIEDYIEIVKNLIGNERNILKAMIVKGKLLKVAGEELAARELLSEVMAEVRRLRFGELEKMVAGLL